MPICSKTSWISKKDFPESLKSCVLLQWAGPLLALTMGLGGQPIGNQEFSGRPTQLRTEIRFAIEQPRRHEEIRGCFLR